MADTNPGLSIQTPDQTEQFSIAPTVPQDRYSPEYTNVKAQRYNVALGPTSPGTTQIENTLNTDGSNQWDQLLGANEQAQSLKIRQNIVQQLAAARGPNSPPTMQDFDLVQSLTNEELHSPNLQDIVNRKFSNDYTNFILTYPGNVVSADGVQKGNPGMLDAGDSAARNVQKALNAQDEYNRIAQKNTTDGLTGFDYWAKKSAHVNDFIGSLVPGYTTLILRGVGSGDNPIGPTSSVLQGENMQDQISNLYAIRDPQKFAETLRARIDEIAARDPSLAEHFAQAVMAYSRSDRIMGNVQTSLDLAGAASSALRVGDRVAEGLKVGTKFAQGTADVGREGGAFTDFTKSPELLGGPTTPADVPGVLPPRGQTALPGQPPQALPDNSRVPTPPQNGRPLTGAGQQMELSGENFGVPTLPADYEPNFQLSQNYPPVGITGGEEAFRRTTLDEFGRPVQPKDYKPNFQMIEPLLNKFGSLKSDYVPNFHMVDGGQSTAQTIAAEEKIVSASMNDPSDISKTAGELGDHQTAVGVEIAQNLQKGDPTGLASLQTTEIPRRLPTGIDPTKPYEEVSDLSAAARNRATDAIIRASADEALDLLRVDRLSQNQVIRAAQERVAQTKNLFPGLSNHIIGNPVIIPAEVDRYSNLYKVEMQFGKRDGMLFPTEKAAENFANRILTPRFSDWEVRQQGIGGYYVSLSRHLSEVDLIRQGGLETGLKAPDSAAHTILNKYVRPADYSLSDEMVKERGRAVNSQSKLAQIFEHTTRNLAVLSNAERADIDSIWAYNRSRGEFSQSTSDFVQKSITATGKFPTQAMVQANEAYNRIYDVDYAFLDAFAVTGMASRGGEKLSIPLVRGGGVEPKTFNGKVVNDLPWGSKDPFWISTVENMKESEYFSRFMTADIQKRINDAIANGSQIVLDPSESKYYIVKDFQRAKITPGNLGWKGGGHHEYVNDWFVKFPDIRESMGGAVNKYVGDVSVMSVATKKDAARIAKSFETARGMFNRNDPGLAKYWADNLDEFISLKDFQQGVMDGKFNPKAPFIATKKGQRSLNSIEPLQGTFRNLVDATQNEHNIFQAVTGKYMQEQAPVTMDVFRSEGNRLIKTTDEALMRPSQALRSSMQNLMDVRVMQDLKDKAARDFIQEYGQYFDGVTQGQLQNNPWYYLTNGRFVDSMDPKLRAVAENIRIAATQLMNTPSTGEMFRHAALSDVGDWVYGLAGPEARQWYNDNLLHTIKDPTVFMRKIGYHTTMGFGNPAQFIVQASELAKISAISPKAAGQAALKFPAFQAAYMTDDATHLNHIANFFGSTIGNKADFLDMVASFKRSGYGIVGHDQGYLSNAGLNSPNSRMGMLAQALGKMSTLPFEKGESLARKWAWMTSYHEWRAANPIGELTRRDESWILQRSRDLNNNMQRDSNAGYQEGWYGNVTQFFRYQVNTALQYWDGGLLSDGRKLTADQKGRKFLLMAMLFGPPAAVGGAMIFPFKEWAQDKLKEQNYEVPSYMEPVMDGLVSAWIHGMSGTKYNFDSFSDGGLTQLNGLLQGDKTLGELLTSMSGNKIFELAQKSGSATLNVLADVMNIEKDGNSIEMTGEDLLQPLRSITSVDKAVRAWQILNTGTWVSKSGSRLVNNASFAEAMADLMANVKPQSINDAYNASGAQKRIQEAQQRAMQDVRTNVQSATLSWNSGDEASAARYLARAKAAGITNGLTSKQYNQAFAQGMSTTSFTERGEQAWKRFQRRNFNQRMPEQ